MNSVTTYSVDLLNTEILCIYWPNSALVKANSAIPGSGC